MFSTGICVQVYSSIPYVQQKLALHGYQFNDKYTEYDNYYTHFSKTKTRGLSYSTLMQNTVLLRTIKGRNKEQDYMVYKNKTLNTESEVIKEERVQTKMGNIEEAKRAFSLSGMNNWCRIVIEELEYKKNNITINIQFVSGLGTFLEVAEYGYTNGSSETKFRELVYLANSLGLDLGRDFSCKKNYMLYKKKNNL